MSLIKKLAGETAIYGVSSILSRLLNYLILAPYLTREFTTAEYGIVNDLYTWAALLMILFTYRMETAFFRFGSRDNQLNKAFSTAALSLIGSTLLYFPLIIFFLDPISHFLHYQETPHYIIWFCIIIALDALAAIPFAQLRLQNRPIRFALIKTLNIIVNILFIFFFLEICPLLLKNGIDWASLIYNEEDRVQYLFLANLLASAFTILLLLPAYFKIELQFDRKLWRQMVLYAFPLIIAGVAAVINQLIAYPMLINFLPGSLEENQSAAGLYGAAAKLAILMSLFTQAFNYAAEPFFFRNANKGDSKEVYAQVAQVFALVGCLVFLGIVFYIDIIQYILGKDFRTQLGIVPILLLAYLFLGLFYNFSIWYKLADKTIIGGYIAIIGALITLSLNYILIPNPAVGIYGPAWTALACYFFMTAASYLTGQRYYPIYYPIGRIAGYILLTLLFYGINLIGRTFYGDTLLLVLGMNTLLLGIYLILLFVWEKSFLLEIMGRQN